MVRQIILRQKNVLFPFPHPSPIIWCHHLSSFAHVHLPPSPLPAHWVMTSFMNDPSSNCDFSLVWWFAGPKMWRVTTVHYHWISNTKYYVFVFTNSLCGCAGGPNGGWYVFSVERISCDWCQCAITCINLISGYNGIQVLEIFSEYHFREPAKYFLADYFPLKGYPSLNRKSAKIFWNKNFL